MTPANPVRTAAGPSLRQPAAGPPMPSRRPAARLEGGRPEARVVAEQPAADRPLFQPLRPLGAARSPEAGRSLAQLTANATVPLAGGPIRHAILRSLRDGGRPAAVAADFRRFVAANRAAITGRAQIVVRRFELAAAEALQNDQKAFDEAALERLRTELEAVRFRDPGAGRILAGLLRRLDDGRLGARHLGDGLRAATFGPGDAFFRQLADLRDFVAAYPDVLDTRAGELFDRLQRRIDDAMDRGVPPTGAERLELLAEVFGRPGAARAIVRPPIPGLRPAGSPTSDCQRLIDLALRHANRRGTDSLITRLSMTSRPITALELAEGLMVALAGRNREQVGGLQWGNFRRGIEPLAPRLTPAAQRVVDRFGRLAAELRADGRVGATPPEIESLMSDLAAIVGGELQRG